MSARYCVPCDKKTNASVCSCGRTTEIVTNDDYTQEQMEEELENGNADNEQVERARADPLRFFACPRHP